VKGKHIRSPWWADADSQTSTVRNPSPAGLHTVTYSPGIVNNAATKPPPVPKSPTTSPVTSAPRLSQRHRNC
jgi:hypothetical protein